jgi:hypothetical protein
MSQHPEAVSRVLVPDLPPGADLPWDSSSSKPPKGVYFLKRPSVRPPVEERTAQVEGGWRGAKHHPRPGDCITGVLWLDIAQRWA